MDRDAAELAGLRRRAYGPHADIADDQAALARLTELERRLGADGTIDDTGGPQIRRFGENRTEDSETGLLSPNHLVRERGSAASADAGPTAGVASSAAAHLGQTGDRPSRRPAWHTAMVVAVAAVSLLVGGAATAQTVDAARPAASGSTAPPADPDPDPSVAFAFVSDPASDVLQRIPLNGIRGQLLDLPNPDDGPEYSTAQGVRWTQPLGEYYGWRLWIARDGGDDWCMLITADETYSLCVTPEERREGALFLSVPYDAVTEIERPVGMTPDQSLGFWWVPDYTVLILTGQTSDAEGD